MKRNSETWIVVLAALFLCPAPAFAAVSSAESGTFVLNLYGEKNPFAASGPGQGTASSESGLLLLDLRGVTGPSLAGHSSESGIFPVNLLGRQGQLSLSGTIYDADTALPIVGATVQGGGQSSTSDAVGAYRLAALSFGNFTLSVRADGYAPLEAAVAIPAGGAAHRKFSLYPAVIAGGGSTPRITGVHSKFPGFLYFLDGVDAPVNWTATVDWGGRSPGKLVFTAPRRAREVTTASGSASVELNMGEDFGPTGRLRVKAVAADGTASPEMLAECVVIPNEIPAVFSQVLSADSFYFKTSVGPNWEFLDVLLEVGIVPEGIPLFGGHDFNLKYIPTFEAELRRNLMDFNLALEGRALPSLRIAGQEVKLAPFAELSGAYDLPGKEWDWQGSAGLNFSANIPTPPVYLPNPLALPLYFKVSLKPEVDVRGTVVDLSPFRFNAGSTIKPYVRGSLGAGFDSVFSGEGWLGGGAEIELQYPLEPHLKDFTVLINGGVTVYALLFKWEAEALRWEWNLTRGSPAGLNLRTGLRELEEPKPELMSRDYLRSDKYALFSANRSGTIAKKSAGKPAALTASAAALQSQVFPHSDPMLSAAGGRAGLVWLYDNPDRASINRTMAVFSQFDGSSWTDPIPVADDGTADFHPRLLAFADGTMLAVWENEKSPLAEIDTFDAMKENLEIAAAWYDPGSSQWQNVLNLTENSFMDRTPRLAGIASDDILLTWISNETSHPTGSAGEPNQIWFSRWNGEQWSPSQVAATVPNGLLRYDLNYDGTTGWLVGSLDLDGDATSVQDRELFRMKFAADQWGPLERFTDDALPDDNPRLASDGRGNLLLTWLRGNELSGIVNFDLARRQVLRRDEYSSNFADFKLARGEAGSLAIVWSEPSEFSSDLWAMFYDPVFELWGNARQLTHDLETERGVTAVMLNERSLLSVYNRTELGLEIANAGANASPLAPMAVPKPGSTDLYVLNYELGDDIALRDGQIELTPTNPGPGDRVEARFAVENRGDRAAEDVAVAFYFGDPAAGGIEIGRTNLNQTLSAGQTIERIFYFDVPADAGPENLFAIADPESALLDAVRSNNAASIAIARPDLALGSLSWSPVAGDLLSVTARVSNEGAVPSQTAAVEFHRDSATGPVLVTRPLDPLDPGQSIDVNFALDAASLPGDITIVPVLAIAGEDFSTANDSALLLIQRIDVNSATIQLAGKVLYYDMSTAIPGVSVILSGGEAGMVTTEDDGVFRFTVPPGADYEVTVESTEESSPRQGVTTFDIALIRRHILGIASLDSPYKILAADVNDSSSVTTLDIALIRRLILAIQDTFPDGLWKFARSDFEFGDPLKPWPFESSRSYSNLSGDVLDQDFVAMKHGDVNHSWTPESGPALAALSSGESAIDAASGGAPSGRDSSLRSAGAAAVGELRQFENGPKTVWLRVGHPEGTRDLIRVPVTVSEVSQLTTAQFTLAWDPKHLAYADVGDFGLAELSSDHFGLARIEEGMLTFSWDDPNGLGIGLPDGAPVFTVTFNRRTLESIFSQIDFAAAPTAPEVSVNAELADLKTEGQLVELQRVSGPPRFQATLAGDGGMVRLIVRTEIGVQYVVEVSEAVVGSSWEELAVFDGDGAEHEVQDSHIRGASRFYRVRTQ